MITRELKEFPVFAEFDPQAQEYWFDYSRDKVAFHIDTLYYSVSVVNDNNDDISMHALIGKLEALKAIKRSNPNSNVSFGSLSVELGSFSFYSLHLSYNENFDIFIASHLPTEQTPRVVVQLRSRALVLDGTMKAVSDSFDYVKEILYNHGFEIADVRENRIDYAYHTNLLSSPSDYFNKENILEHMKSTMNIGHVHGDIMLVPFDEVFNVRGSKIETSYFSLGNRKSNNVFVRVYNKTQEVIVETLRHDVRFCLFPEGTHRTRHSLQTLGKGAMRIALAANEEFGKEKPVYLLPVGLEYGDYFRYRSTSLLTYGKPINVTEFLKNNSFESEPQAIDALRKALSNEMTQLITYIPSDDQYEGKWALTKMMAIEGVRRGYGDRFTRLSASMAKNREIAKTIEEKLAQKPEQMCGIISRCEKFEANRRNNRVSIYSFRKNNNVLSAIFKTLSAIIGLPYFIYSAIASLPMWAIETKIRKGIKDPAFGNTVSFGVKLGVGLILFLIYTPLAFCLAPWWLALTLIGLWIPSHSYLHDYIEGCRRWISDIRLMFNRPLKEEFQSIVKEYRQL